MTNSFNRINNSMGKYYSAISTFYFFQDIFYCYFSYFLTLLLALLHWNISRGISYYEKGIDILLIQQMTKNS